MTGDRTRRWPPEENCYCGGPEWTLYPHRRGTGLYCRRDRTPTGDLRAQLRRVLHAYDTDIDARAAEAVMPVVEAETAALRQRAEEADDRAEAAGYEATSARLDLREAERQLQQALDQIATERRGRLAAEAAARRGREIHRRHDCGRHANPRTPVPCANHGLCEGCGAPWPCRTFTALDAEQPKETP